MSASSAQQPSYIGPYEYRTGPTDSTNQDKVFASPMDGILAVIAYRNVAYIGTPFEHSWCNYRLGTIDPWIDNDRVVEGVQTSGYFYYTIAYDVGCPQGAVPQTGAELRAVGRTRLVCASYQKLHNGQCISTFDPYKIPAGAKGANLGPSCPNCGQPINPNTGNMWHVEPDFQSSATPNALSIVRTYNSAAYRLDGATSRGFGVRWTHSYDSTLSATVVLPDYADQQCWRIRGSLEVFCDRPQPTNAAIPDVVSILRGDGKSYVFQRNGNVWVGDADTNDRVTPTFSADQSAVIGWTYLAANTGSAEKYTADGKLLSITARAGAVQLLTYSGGGTNDTSIARIPADSPVCPQVQTGVALPANRLVCVTDNWGRQIQFKYDASGRIIEAIDPANRSTLYEYDGLSGGCLPESPNSVFCKSNNLTKVTYPDGKSRTYFYNEPARINDGLSCSTQFPPITPTSGQLPNALTGLMDENGVRHVSWSYDCLGRATISELANGVEKVKLAYAEDAAGAVTAQVTHYLGDSVNPQTTLRTMLSKPVLGVSKNVSVSGPCVECGNFAARTFDANGNVLSATDFLGVQTTSSYDMARNLELSRTEASGTALARTITTAWHPVLRSPIQIAEPKRLTTLTYDDKGNLLTRAEQATSDQTGAAGLTAPTTGSPRTWAYTYNAVGQVLTITGPRTDVNERTLYAYDASGNLQTVTNALGHVTTLSNYDANGNVGRIVAPNGSTTELSYTARGWLASRSVEAAGVTETTTYEHDGVGQITRVTMPDASWVAYVYDDAHRLTGVNDSAGNSMTYILDLTGNRTREQARDPGGALRRQITRVFDTMNRIQQQTGGAQ